MSDPKDFRVSFLVPLGVLLKARNKIQARKNAEFWLNRELSKYGFSSGKMVVTEIGEKESPADLSNVVPINYGHYVKKN